MPLERGSARDVADWQIALASGHHGGAGIADKRVLAIQPTLETEMTITIRTALLSALVLSLTCGFATASDLPTAIRAAKSSTADVAPHSAGGVRQLPLMVKCKDPIECSKGRA